MNIIRVQVKQVAVELIKFNLGFSAKVFRNSGLCPAQESRHRKCETGGGDFERGPLILQ